MTINRMTSERITPMRTGRTNKLLFAMLVLNLSAYALPVSAQSGKDLAVMSQESERVFAHALLNQFEVQGGSGDSAAQAWDGEAWIGGDYNKLWVKSEGSSQHGRVRDADVELLYDRAVSAYWDVQAGMRRDFRPGPAQNWAAFGVQGLAPYWFDVEATAYAGSGGRTAARVKAFYELLFTQRLILQPEIEANLYGRDEQARGIGSGLSDTRLGLRLRYEIRREFAPYIGVERRQRYGRTADFARASGEPSASTVWVAGLRLWY